MYAIIIVYRSLMHGLQMYHYIYCSLLLIELASHYWIFIIFKITQKLQSKPFLANFKITTGQNQLWAYATAYVFTQIRDF